MNADPDTCIPTPAGEVPSLQLARTPGHLIRRAQRIHAVLWAREVGGELTSSQFAILSAVSTCPGIDQTTAGSLASLDKATTVGIVRRLVEHRWLETVADDNDARRKLLHLSRPTHKALKLLTTQAANVQAALLSPLTDDQQRAFLSDIAIVAYEGSPPAPHPIPPDWEPRHELGLVPSVTPGHLIRRAQQAHTMRWTGRFQGALTGPQYAVLCVLASLAPRDQSTLGDAAALDKSSIAEVIDRLHHRGFVIVDDDTTDRRRRPIRLSDAGCKWMFRFTPAAAAVQAGLMDLLPAEAHERLLAALAAVAYQNIPPTHAALASVRPRHPKSRLDLSPDPPLR